MTRKQKTIADLPAYAVIIRATWERGETQRAALSELAARGLWLSPEMTFHHRAKVISAVLRRTQRRWKASPANKTGLKYHMIGGLALGLWAGLSPAKQSQPTHAAPRLVAPWVEANPLPPDFWYIPKPHIPEDGSTPVGGNYPDGYKPLKHGR